MSEVLICKSCKSTWRGERVKDLKCPECKSELKPLQVSLEEWNSYDRVQKESVKQSFLQDIDKSISDLSPNYVMESYLSNINKNIQTIRNIMVFFTVLWGISVFIFILTLGSFARFFNNMLR